VVARKPRSPSARFRNLRRHDTIALINNCFLNNDFTTEFSFRGELPLCPDDPGTGGTGGMGTGGTGADGGSGGTGGTDEGNGGGGCAVGSTAPSRPSTTWLALLCCAWALLLRRRLRRR
jgi:hypothetical protein